MQTAIFVHKNLYIPPRRYLPAYTMNMNDIYFQWYDNSIPRVKRIADFQWKGVTVVVLLAWYNIQMANISLCLATAHSVITQMCKYCGSYQAAKWWYIELKKDTPYTALTGCLWIQIFWIKIVHPDAIDNTTEYQVLSTYAYKNRK